MVITVDLINYQINYRQQYQLRYFMQESEIGSQSQINIQQQSQIQCKICFLKKAPLLRLCDCKGSIGFVHQDCILRWLTIKLQQMALLQMPCCEVCKSPYTAQLKSLSNKTSLALVVRKIKQLSYKNIIAFLIIIIGMIALPYIEVVGIERLWKNKVDNYILWVFNFVVFPFYFMKTAFQFARLCQQKWKQCRIRQVQICLLPKEIYR